MDDFELFPTKDEALAFIKGLKAADDHLDTGFIISTELTQLSTGEYRVDYSFS